MNHKLDKMFYIVGGGIAAILLISSFYIKETKKATSHSSDALLETLHWFQIANVLYGLGVVIIALLLIYFIKKNRKL